jgi:hypothetical protein
VKHPITLALNFLLINLTLTAQKVELGINAGITNYTGDVAPTLVLNETRFGGGGFMRYNFNHTWAFVASINQMRIGGSDQHFAFNAPRNIQFRTDITELAGVFEFNYFKYGAGVLDKHFTPYIFWGLGMSFFRPQGLYKNKWYNLRSLQTEGPSNAYGSFTAVMPMGIGLKWMPTKRMSFEWNLGLRKTYTDYLDDVSNTYPDISKQLEQNGVVAAALTDPSTQLSNGAFQNKIGYQRGNPDIKDWYFATNISVTWRIFTRSRCSRFY